MPAMARNQHDQASLERITALAVSARNLACDTVGENEKEISRKREFYRRGPRFSSQASRASNRSSLSFRSASAAHWRNRLRKAGGTLNASACRLAVFVGASAA